MSECIHEMAIESCSFCKPKPTAIFWDARYDGTCTASGCSHPEIKVGERVKWSSDGTRTIHAGHQE